MDDPLVHCPFELSHTCKQSRFQKHLIKCRKNHPESKLEPCPFNATEYIHPDDLIEHLKVCQKAKLLEAQKYSAELHKENYLDAPFIMPKHEAEEVEPEDFEDQEVSVNDTDERVLERSVSQMSLNSIGSNESLGAHDKVEKTYTPINLVSRASTLRGVGRGSAMASLMSALEPTDGMDYSKYEIRSTVTDKPEIIDPEFAHPSRLSSISTFDKNKSKFEDCLSEEEEENVSVCSSKSTIIENNSVSVENYRQSWAESPEPLKTVGIDSDSEDDEFYGSSQNIPNENFANNSDVSNERDSSSSSFYSLIRANFMQNAALVRGTERVEERTSKFGRGRPGYHQNHPRNCGASYEHNGTQSQNGGGKGRGALLKAWINASHQPKINHGQHFNENGHQNYPSQSNYNQGNRYQNQKSQNSMQYDQYGQRTYSNQQSNYPKWQNQSSNQEYPHQGYSNQQNGYRNPRNQNPQQQYSDHSNHSSQNRGRGPAGDSASRGFSNGDSYPSKPKGRGNLAERLGSGDCWQHNSIGRGNHFQENAYSERMPFNQNGGNFHNQSNSFHNASEQSVGRGNYHNHGNTFNKQGFFNQEKSFGRGSLFNQVPIGRGTYLSQEKGNQGKPIGRGSLLASSGSAEAPIGRGCMLAQFSNFENVVSVGRGRPNGDNQYDVDNFRGKSEFYHHSFEAAYHSFMDLQIEDYSPVTSPTAKVISVPMPLAQPNSTVDSSASKIIKPKTKKKKKKKETSSESPVVVPCSNSETNAEVCAKVPGEASFKILDKSMDPKKYFGADGDETDSNQETNQVSSSENKNEKKSKQDSKVVLKQNKKVSSKSDSNSVKVDKNISENTKSVPAKTFKKKFASKNNFQVYDQFYSNMSFGPLIHDTNSDPRNQNNVQAPSAQAGQFTERMEEERLQNNPRRMYASCNFIQVSQKPVEPASNIPPPKLAFSSLHEPQRPRYPGRYDKLEGTGHKFMLRQLNKKQKALNHKPNIVSHGKKVFKASGVAEHKSDANLRMNNVPLNFHFPKNNFQNNTKSDMSLWNKKSYTKISSGDNSSHDLPQKYDLNFNPPPKFNSNFLKNDLPQKYDLNSNPPPKFNSNFLKNEPKKQSFVVMKEKINHVQKKHPKNREPKQRLRYPNGMNFLGLLSDPFEKPVAYGPSQSCHLNYSSHKPLSDRDFYEL